MNGGIGDAIETFGRCRVYHSTSRSRLHTVRGSVGFAVLLDRLGASRGGTNVGPTQFACQLRTFSSSTALPRQPVSHEPQRLDFCQSSRNPPIDDTLAIERTVSSNPDIDIEI